MPGTEKLLNTIICIAAFVLIISYFLPVEASWSPVDAWKGYYDAGGENTGLSIGLIEAFPFAVGLIALMVILLLRYPKITVAVCVVFSVVWAVIVILEVNRIRTSGGYRFGNFWFIFASAVIFCLFVFLLMVLFRAKIKTVALTLCLLLAVASLIQQICSVAWSVLEDNLLLNIGSVTGISGATSLIICLLIKTQLRNNPPNVAVDEVSQDSRNNCELTPENCTIAD
jgi:hypothetical protein